MKYVVQYEDGIQYKATLARIKTNAPVKIGNSVNCRWIDGRFYPAKIVDIINGEFK